MANTPKPTRNAVKGAATFARLIAQYPKATSGVPLARQVAANSRSGSKSTDFWSGETVVDAKQTPYGRRKMASTNAAIAKKKK